MAIVSPSFLPSASLLSVLNGRSIEVENFSSGWRRFDFLPNRFWGPIFEYGGAEESLVLAQTFEQQMLGLNVGRTKQTGFLAGKEDYPASTFGRALKHRKFVGARAGACAAKEKGQPISCPLLRSLLTTRVTDVPEQGPDCGLLRA